MSWERAALAGLQEHDIDVVAYLPDSVLADFVERIEGDDGITAVRVSREEEGAAVLSGAWLGGRRGALVCQSSGLANCFNAVCPNQKRSNASIDEKQKHGACVISSAGARKESPNRHATRPSACGLPSQNPSPALSRSGMPATTASGCLPASNHSPADRQLTAARHRWLTRSA